MNDCVDDETEIWILNGMMILTWTENVIHDAAQVISTWILTDLEICQHPHNRTGKITMTPHQHQSSH